MSTQEMILRGNSESPLISNRVFGTVGMIFSPMLFLGMLIFSPNYEQPDLNSPFAGLGGILYLLGAMASAAAMRRMRVTGNGTGAQILYVVQMIGLALAMCFDMLENTAPQLRGTTVYFITDMAYPFSHVLMTIVGIAVVKAGVWRGWRRLPAFMIGSGLPLFFGLSTIVGRENAEFTFPLFTILGFFSLGLAVYTTKTDR